MSEIQTLYPTSGMSDRSLNSIMTAFYNCLNNIPEVTDFFDSVEKLGDETTNYDGFGIKFTKGNSYIRLRFDNVNGGLELTNNSVSSNYSSTTQNTKTVDIAVCHTVGLNGTNVIWFDNYDYNVCMVFNKFGDKYFLASSGPNSGSISLYYSDTGGSVSNLAKPFNGDNIGKAAEYIAQPYYHLGINTGDIYTFDGGGANIPWGKFKLADSEFVRLTGNFALRIK